MKNTDNLPVAIIGGGPVGLAAAAHLVKRKIPFQLFETGDTVGANFLTWQHVRVFSPWRYNIDKVAEQLLLETDWKSPDKEALPTGGELVRDYFQPLASHPAIRPGIRLNTKVLSIGRKGMNKMKTWGREKLPFTIKVEEKGVVRYYEAKAVIDASGTWNQPNPIGSGGVYAEGEEELEDQIFYGIPDVKNGALHRYKNKNVVVVGSGHSAINVLLDLADVQEEYPDTQLNWVLRKENIELVYGGKKEDVLKARGALGIRIEQLVNSGRLNVFTPFHILKLVRDADGKIKIHGKRRDEDAHIDQVDEIISNTGSRPNLEMIREIRTGLDASLESVAELAELIDPNIHSCGTVRPHGEQELRQPEQDFYIVGSKSYGRAPTFLMTTGYEQVRSVIAYLDGDKEAALRVELDLPQTGVCSSNQKKTVTALDCCGPDQKEVIEEDTELAAVAVCCG